MLCPELFAERTRRVTGAKGWDIARGKAIEGYAGSREESWYWWLSIAVVLFGGLLRFSQFVANRSLWLDEALLAENISQGGILHLFGPLLNGQSAPVGFLLLEKIIAAPFGYSDWSLRLIPLFAGLASLYFFLRLSREVLSPSLAFMACAFFSVVDSTIYYSSEVKPYSSDVCCAIVVVFLGHHVLTQFSWKRLWALVIFGSVTIWISFPSVFVLGGVWTVVLIQGLLGKENRRCWMTEMPAISIAWTSSALVLFFAFLKNQKSTTAMQEFWKFAFMPLPPSSIEHFGWFFNRAHDFFVNPLAVEFPVLAVSMTLFGFGVVIAKRRVLASLCGLPIVFALLASGLHLYPFARRLILFLVPFVIIIIVSGLGFVMQRSRAVAWTLFGLIILSPAVESGHYLFFPRTHEDIKPLLKDLKKQWQPGDQLVVDSVANPAFASYEYLHGFQSTDYEVKDSKSLGEIHPHSRVWFLTSHRYSREISAMSMYLQEMRTLLFSKIAVHSYQKMDGEAALFLFGPRSQGKPIYFRPGIGNWHGMNARDTWSSSSVVISGININLSKQERVLSVCLTGLHPFRNDLKLLGLRVFVNEEEMVFVHRYGNRYVFDFAEGHDHTEYLLCSIRLEAIPFVPKDLGTGSDSRSLGLDLQYIEIGRIAYEFYPAEEVNAEVFGDPSITGRAQFRWSGKRSSLILPAGNRGEFFIKAGHPDIESNPVVVEVFDDGEIVDRITLDSRKWMKLRLHLKEKDNARVLTFEVCRTWNPKGLGVSGDSRDLGIAVALLADGVTVPF